MSGKFDFKVVAAKLKSPPVKYCALFLVVTGVLGATFQNCAKQHSASSSSSSTTSSAMTAPLTANGRAALTPAQIASIKCVPIYTSRIQSQAVPGLVSLSVTHACGSSTVPTYHPVSTIYVRKGKILSASRKMSSVPKGATATPSPSPSKSSTVCVGTSANPCH